MREYYKEVGGYSGSAYVDGKWQHFDCETCGLKLGHLAQGTRRQGPPTNSQWSAYNSPTTLFWHDAQVHCAHGKLAVTEDELLRLYAEDVNESHSFDVFGLPPVPLAEKLKTRVWTGTAHHVIELIPTADVYQREGFEMGHCLQYLHEEYAAAAARGDNTNYSLIDFDGKALVDVEVVLKKSAFIEGRFSRPTVVQVRGFRNQCPPRDDLLPDLMGFLEHNVKTHNWDLTPDVSNFDGKHDGRLTVNRWRALST
jgi:hypothetical protein